MMLEKKKKNDKMDFINIQNTLLRGLRDKLQITNHIYDKGLESRIYKELSIATIRKKNQMLLLKHGQKL